MDTHIFVATGNNSGSTFILNLLSLCKNAVTFPKEPHKDGYIIMEGQHADKHGMPNFELRGNGLVWTENIDQVAGDKHYNWETIRSAWEDLWRRHQSYNSRDRIFIEKSPQNVGRVHLLEEEFENAWFLAQVRNPYVVAEGIRRRMAASEYDIRRTGRHSIKLLELCKTNLEDCNQVLAWRYEDLFAKPHIIEDMISGSIFGLEDFSLTKVIPSKLMDGYEQSVLTDQNPKQLENLSEKDIRILNEVFDEYSNTMMFFNYERMI